MYPFANCTGRHAHLPRRRAATGPCSDEPIEGYMQRGGHVRKLFWNIPLPLSLSRSHHPVDPVQPPVNLQEDDGCLRDDEHISSDGSAVSSLPPSVQPPATADIASTAPSPDHTIQPSPEHPLPSPSVSGPPGPDSDDGEMEMRDLYIPALIAPARLLPIPSLRLSYFFKPVLTWWLSKDVLSYPYLYS
jgi:hypothetical protein